MADRNSLAALIEAVEGGSIAPFYGEFRSALGAVLRDHGVNAYDGSLDAAKALHDALLPGWCWTVSGEYAAVMDHDGSDDLRALRFFEARNDNPARGWLLAVLRALTEKGEVIATPAPVVPAEGLDALLVAAQTIIDRGYVSKSIPEEKPDHDALQSAIAALRPAPPVGARVSIPPGLIDALRSQRQIDADGCEVAVSRQACDEAAAILAALLPAGEKDQ